MTSKVPEYASQVPYVPHNFEDRDAIVGRLMEILEAVMPESNQLRATKQLVKKCLTEYFIVSFNDQFDALVTHLAREGNFYHSPRDRYYRAIWDMAQTETESSEEHDVEERNYIDDVKASSAISK